MKKVIEFHDNGYDDFNTLIAEIGSQNFYNLKEKNETFKKYLKVRRKVFEESPILYDLIGGEPNVTLSKSDILNLQKLIESYNDTTCIHDEGMFIKGIEYGIKICKDLGVKIKSYDEN